MASDQSGTLIRVGGALLTAPVSMGFWSSLREARRRKWPERTEGWEERLIERVHALFASLAERHGLRMEWDDEAPVEVACIFPEQEGLDFELCMNLQNSDELSMSHEMFWTDSFPADDPEVWETFEKAADGMLSGEARAVIHYAFDRKKPFRTEVQIQKDGRWMTVDTGIILWRLPWIKRSYVIQNKARGRGG